MKKEERIQKFIDIADILDKLYILSEKEDLGEDVTEESEELIGKMIIKLLKIQKEFLR